METDIVAEKLVISAPFNPVACRPLKQQLHEARSDGERKSALSRILDLLKTFGHGSDLTRFQVPVHLNMPKSQLQLYGESVYCGSSDLLEACAKGATHLDRFLKVVAWHISTTRLAPFGQAPFNPVLGETHHVSCGDLNVLLEQVSHHPPISALYATNEKASIRLQWYQCPTPRFYGNGVEVNIHGKRELWIDSYMEVYEMTSPNLMIQFFPTFSNEWIGRSIVKCIGSNLEAHLRFHSKPFFGWLGSVGQISGEVIDSSTQTSQFRISGFYNRQVTIEDMETGKISVLFDAEKSLVGLKAIEVQDRKSVKPTESLVVWREVMKGITERDWNTARKAKQEIEEKQRSLAKERKRQGVLWTPRYFELTTGGHWQWRFFGQHVQQAPLTSHCNH